MTRLPRVVDAFVLGQGAGIRIGLTHLPKPIPNAPIPPRITIANGPRERPNSECLWCDRKQPEASGTLTKTKVVPCRLRGRSRPQIQRVQCAVHDDDISVRGIEEY